MAHTMDIGTKVYGPLFVSTMVLDYGNEGVTRTFIQTIDEVLADIEYGWMMDEAYAATLKELVEENEQIQSNIIVDDAPAASALQPWEITPVMPAPQRGTGIINVIGVETKARTRFGNTYPGQKYPDMNADIVKNVSIRIYGISETRVHYDRDTHKQYHYKKAYDLTFMVGDSAVYDSYNFDYTGEIVAIGEKTVTIQEDKYRKNIRRLDLHDFIRRNWDYSPERIMNERMNWND